ncbi:MAG: hypothetical protein CMJ65_16705 [Planctomycetaceae bacterium]|jgi:Flp pilus assembly protein TadD|nr:hypothetical protein [Planctomycetaceae bacterium]
MNQQSPTTLGRRIEAAEGYLLLEMSERALRELREVESLVDEDSTHCFELTRLRAEAFRQLEDYREGARQFLAAQAMDREDLSVSIGLAWCLKRSDRLDEAIDVMLAAYELHNDEAIVLYNLSCYFALAGDKTNALSWLGRALRMEASLRSLILEETDFDGLRNDSDFRLITGELTRDQA